MASVYKSGREVLARRGKLLDEPEGVPPASVPRAECPVASPGEAGALSAPPPDSGDRPAAPQRAGDPCPCGGAFRQVGGLKRLECGGCGDSFWVPPGKERMERMPTAVPRR